MPQRSTASPAMPFVAACTGVALFSVMDALMKDLSIDIGAYNALLWRSAAGSVFGAVFMIIQRNPWPTGAVLKLHLLRGIVVAFMALAFFWGLVRVPLAEAIALSFIAPLIALYLSALLLKEVIGRNTIIGSLLGLAGVAVVVAGRVQGAYDAAALWGAGAVLLSAVLFAYNLVLQRQQAQVASPTEIAFSQSVVIGLVLGLAAPWLAVMPTIAHAPLIIGSAVLAFASLFVFGWAYARAEAQALIPVEYTAFIWAAILGWLMFGEAVTFTTLAGTVLIVAGCFLAARQRPELAHVETGTV